ncbi:MAG TPA: SRPBCC family protein [Amaricoccus sp.]|uniref:SRPBCC family protein n=1 Tax=Amaricoccus sp. TaxID=1872485 RepID=UPI002CC84E13|nr:SRPBCC family protein [Amaricoccus sp.]HMQ93111.1 SRPBCC family protein [Amaricoccus sp.]HMR53898.1 SRPBCC family protein [Amaricoccus sp.]HMR60289.1 SRPBCC family protein [Amaricoccus sp.]HMU00923.1 SRPBCC family protein [Amaricoccus sp.]
MAYEFDLTTEWDLSAPVSPVWAALRAVEAWPAWWRSVRKVEPLVAGSESGIGAVHRLTWQTALPYRLVLTTEVTAVQPERRIEVRARGDIEGTGVWTLLPRERDGCRVRYLWRVRVTKPWMRAVLPVLKPAFAWNHREVMRIGGAGMARLLANGNSNARG